MTILPWRIAECGFMHEWGICTGEHQLQDSEDYNQKIFPEGNPLMVVKGTDDLSKLLRDHALTSSFADGTVICKCGHASQLVWFTEHVVEVVRASKE